MKSVTIVSCGCGECSRSAMADRLVEEADVLIGGNRLLGLYPDFQGETHVIAKNVENMVRGILEAVENADKKLVVLASGDSQFHGIAKLITKLVDKERLTIIPNVTAAQTLFAKLKLGSWRNARFFSVHGLGIDALPWRQVLNAELSVVYGDHKCAAADIAATLVDRYPACAGLLAAIGENLGDENERVVTGTLAELAETKCGPLSVLVVFNEAKTAVMDAGLPLGLSDDSFEREGGLITHPEARAVALSKLKIGPGVMWDLGAGSGSVSIEAASLCSDMMVYAIERKPERMTMIKRNVASFGCPNVVVENGNALELIEMLPAPRSVFIGGGGDDVAGILEKTYAKLIPGGRIVASAVTLETKSLLASTLSDALLEVVSLSVSRAKKVGDKTMLAAENTVELYVYGGKK